MPQRQLRIYNSLGQDSFRRCAQTSALAKTTCWVDNDSRKQNAEGVGQFRPQVLRDENFLNYAAAAASLTRLRRR